MKFFRRSTRSLHTPFPIMEGLGARESSYTKFPDLELSPDAAVRQGIGRPLGMTIRPGRFRGVMIGTIVFMSILAGRAGQLQIVQGASYKSLAEGNRVRTYVISPPRGVVTDRNGVPLIQNVPSFTLEMIPADVPKEILARAELFARVADIAGIDPLILEKAFSPFVEKGNPLVDPYDPIQIRRGIPFEQAMRLSIETSHWHGFRVTTATTRQYATSAAPSLSHVLGYTGSITDKEYDTRRQQGYRRTDDIGKTGIERGLEDILRGEPGALTVEVDAYGRELSVVSRTDALAGSNVTLSIDAEFQRYAEERLRDMLKKTGTSRGSIVAIDPDSGGVRALISWPAYDSNAFARRIDPDQYRQLAEDEDLPLFPRAVSGEFPSGSTFKPFVAYAALKEHIIDETTSFLSVGGISVGPWYFPDWKAGGHGITNVRKALAESINTFFYIVGGGYDRTIGLGVDRITEYARQFGFGEKTGIELPAEADGFLPSKEWKEETKGEPWYVGDTYHLAIGQGDLLATPLQVAAATAAIANGGTTIQPTLIEGIDGDRLPERSQVIRTFDAYDVQVVREGMRQAVTKGSARALSVLPVAVAGKTGTAQTPGDQPTHAWFIGFAPYDHPTLVLTVLIEHGGEGSSVAVPVARDLFDWWFTHRSQ